MTDSRDELDTELANAWVRELYAWWEQFDADHLGGALRRPQIVILGTEHVVGQWDRARRTLGISAAHIRQVPWRVVLETLRHEMAHQYVDEVLGSPDESPHGALFRAACAKLDVTPRASLSTSDREGARGEDHQRVRLLRRVEKLLSLADSPNENEAAAAFRKARRLMVEHRLELGGRESGYTIRELGPVAGRHQAWEFVLANILDRFFFVDVIWAHTYDATRAKRGTVLRVFGTETHLDMAEYVHAFVVGVVERLWVAYRERRGIRGNRDRMRYYHGLVLGLQDKLAAQDRAMREEEGLILVDDPELRAFFEQQNPRRQVVRRGGAAPSAARRDGEREGRSIRIAKPLGGSGGFGGLLEG